MEGQVDKDTKVLAAIDLAVVKLRTWALETLEEVGGTQEELELLKTAMNRDSLLYVPMIRDMIKAHGHELFHEPDLDKVAAYFQGQLPKAYARFRITRKILFKGLLFAKVFQSLFKDLQ